MYSAKPASICRWPTEPVPLDSAAERSFDDLDKWAASGQSRLWDDVWEAFELDDELTDPQPAHGDFWGQPDDEEEI